MLRRFKSDMDEIWYRIVLGVNTHRQTVSDIYFDVKLSRWQMSARHSLLQPAYANVDVQK